MYDSLSIAVFYILPYWELPLIWMIERMTSVQRTQVQYHNDPQMICLQRHHLKRIHTLQLLEALLLVFIRQYYWPRDCYSTRSTISDEDEAGKKCGVTFVIIPFPTGLSCTKPEKHATSLPKKAMTRPRHILLSAGMGF